MVRMPKRWIGLGGQYYGAHVVFAGRDRAQFYKLRACFAGNDARQCGFATARRTPQNQAGGLLMFDDLANDLAGSGQLLLANYLFQCLRAHALG
jgi:hypothetical protein